VPASAPNPKPEKPPHPHRDVPQVYSLEATGLIVVAVVILIITLIRYWHNIAWSAR
jgi:hypothetical protein